MNMLQKIIAHKKLEVMSRKELAPVKLLESSIYFGSQAVSLRHYLTRPGSSGIIAEIKRRSPSRGIINAHISVEQLSIGYMQAGAAALSVLTDGEFFGGSAEDLKTARKFNFCPILRKDFVIDEYQILESRAIGADAVLLIAAVLSPDETAALARSAHELGMEVLLEIHSREELESHFNDCVDITGVNNRNLETFEVSLETAAAIAPFIPEGCTAVAESGIHGPEDVRRLKDLGFCGFLIGEHFMSCVRPEKACEQFIRELEK